MPKRYLSGKEGSLGKTNVRLGRVEEPTTSQDQDIQKLWQVEDQGEGQSGACIHLGCKDQDQLKSSKDWDLSILSNR